MDDVAEETMSMTPHGDQIALFRLDDLQNFLWRIPECKMSCHRDSFLANLISHPFQIGAVCFYFLGFSKLELIKIARRETVSNVQEEQIRPELLCKFLHMRQE